MPWLIQMGKKPISENVSGVGLFVFPSGEPTEVKDDHLAGVLLERLAWAGLTRVPETRVGGLPQFDLRTARAAAGEALKQARKGLVERYIQNQLETRVRQNMPPMPPSPSVQEIIEEDGWDLAGYGIFPVGWKVEEKTKAQDKRLEDLEAANVALQETNRLLIERMDILMGQMEQGKKGK
jgi:hypothetical protein